MRIAHVVEAVGEGGVTTVALDLALEQRRRGHQVAIFALSHGGWETRVRSAGLPLWVGAARLLQMRSFDIIHTHQRRAGLVSVLLGGRRKTVEHVHNLVRGQKTLSFRGAEVVAVSSNVASHLEIEYPRLKGKVRIVRNGVAASATPHYPDKPQPSIVAAGRLDDQKNPLLFLRVLAELKRLDTDFTATWYGNGPLRADFLKSIDTFGLGSHVAHHDFIPRNQLLEVVAGSSLLLSSSAWEGLMMVGLEALSVGTPVIMTPSCDLAEDLRAAGAGAVIDADDPRSAATAISRFLHSQDYGLARVRARALFEREFMLTEVVRRWEVVYGEIA